jgi:hypothetical protein
MLAAEESMTRISIAVAAMASALFLQFWSSAASPQRAAGSAFRFNPSDTVALKYLWWSLQRSHSGGRFYYSVPDCNGPPFPEIKIRRPTKDLADAAAIRRYFAGQPRVRVSDSDGIIRIDLGGVPTAILQTKIAQLSFSPEEQYNPQLAVAAIEHAPEVQARMKKLRVRSLALPMEMLLMEPAPGPVHLAAVMEHITMDDALDVVARTFHGLVETGYCRRNRLMENLFEGGTYSDSRPGTAQ